MRGSAKKASLGEMVKMLALVTQRVIEHLLQMLALLASVLLKQSVEEMQTW